MIWASVHRSSKQNSIWVSTPKFNPCSYTVWILNLGDLNQGKSYVCHSGVITMQANYRFQKLETMKVMLFIGKQLFSKPYA
jgi:hypothetical protein